MKQKVIVIPTKNAESWRDLLADPEKHWKDGYSAKLIAESWELIEGIPVPIKNSLQKHDTFKDSELLLAIPEFKVPLPGHCRTSQNDILVITSNKTGLSVITVEGKCKEGFDVTMSEWRVNMSEGKKMRLSFLLETIQYPDIDIDHLYYQLFHRLASAVIVAKKFHAQNAMLIIQSFVNNDAENHYEDYCNFISGYGIQPKKDEILRLKEIEGIGVYALWSYTSPLKIGTKLLIA